MSREPALLILRALGLGDLLTGIPALRALARAFPSHRRILAAPAALAPLALHTGVVDEVADTQPLAALDRALREPDVAVNLHGRGPASHRVLLAARPKRLIAFANGKMPQSARGPAWRADEHEVDRWCRLLAETGIPADPGDLELAAPRMEPPADALGATLIHPGAASAARRWPVERFAGVAQAECAAGRPVVITGSADEAGLAAEIVRKARLPRAASYAGRTDLLQLTALVAAAGRVVAGDTGVAHLATALRRPSVVLFGPTSPAHWGPPSDRPWHVCLWRGGRGDPHGDRPEPGLLEIGVAEVLEALERLEPQRRAA